MNKSLYIILVLVVIFLFTRKTEYFDNRLKKLLRQSSRWSLAAKQDKTPLIAVLHANYGAAYLWAIKDIFSEKEIEDILGSKEMRLKFEKEIISIQDKVTKEAIKQCPNFSGQIGILSKMAGEG